MPNTLRILGQTSGWLPSCSPVVAVLSISFLDAICKACLAFQAWRFGADSIAMPWLSQ